eukprot:gnl/TRDRNA2_/TRDRNA2_182335_c0_seq1.p1 gnl/TRDRNA2_/TRDRNA2_182335_c0~~gnl/TRDRNA2_/TRDRNA2_182335_c0_seq1.p1  ORF type:complete len:187 (-),score=39.97 gnl/TRDRNA2_/TRDRNA2_182335_c0_seq1:220-780(-)
MVKTQERPEIGEKRAGSLYSKTDLIKVVSEYINDVLPLIGYEEDHFWTNIRIILCIVCCGFGCYAQFGTKFPKDRMVLAACVVGYFVFSGVLYLIDYYIIKTSVMCIKVGELSVFVDVQLGQFNTELTMSMRTQGQNTEFKEDVSHYFDTNRILRQEHLFTDLMTLIKRYEKESKEGASKETKKTK